MVKVKHFYVVHETAGKRCVSFYGDALTEWKSGKIVSEVFVFHVSVYKTVVTQKVEYFF